MVPGLRTTTTTTTVAKTTTGGMVKMTKDGARTNGSPVRKAVKKRSPSNRRMKVKKKAKV